MSRILVIKLGALGDMILATSLIQAIQDHHHNDELHLLTAPAFAGLFADWPGLQVSAFPRQGARAMWRALSWIRGQRFARLYDLQSNDRSQLLTALSGVRERVGNHPRFPYTHHPEAVYRGPCHVFERMQQLLASAGVREAKAQAVLPISDADRQRVGEWLQAHQLEAGTFCIAHAGASATWPSKRWPFYPELAAALQSSGMTTVWIGAGDDAELNRKLAQQAGIDASNVFSIRQLVVLGQQARFAVVNDSGPMHILSASSLPIFAFFGPTDWRRSHALGQSGRILHDDTVDCSPCSLGHCPPEHGHRCLRQISVTQVLQRLSDEGLIDQIDQIDHPDSS